MTPPETITAAQFQALGALIWGDGWRHDAADALGVGLRNVQFWAAEPPARCKPVPAGVIRDLWRLAADLLRHPEEMERARRMAENHAAQARILDMVTAPEN